MRRSRIITAPMITITRRLGAQKLRPVEQLGFVEDAEQLRGVGDGDSAGVAA
jgi:hypothetical protein